MWCRDCQQDVPGVASGEDSQRICCARCGSLMKIPVETAETANSGSTEADVIQDAVLPPLLDTWQMEDDLRESERLIRHLRFDSSHDNVSETPPQIPLPAFPTTPLRQQNRPRSTRRRRRSPWLSWTTLSLGLMTFVCGGVLLGWSFATGRSDLWSLGMPLTMAGQAAMIMGLVLQMDGLWQTNQDTTETLDELDDQLHHLHHTTTLITSSHSDPARSFYTHMSEGASPELLLADLKGQLDLLTTKMANHQR
jgi:hypothetical protein